MKKFEYKIVSFSKMDMMLNKTSMDDVETTLTGEGVIGWEVISSFENLKASSQPELCFLMKREIIQE